LSFVAVLRCFCSCFGRNNSHEAHLASTDSYKKYSDWGYFAQVRCVINPARNFHTKTACTLRCRRAAWVADVELLAALQQTVPVEPFDPSTSSGQAKLRANGGVRRLTELCRGFLKTKYQPNLEKKLAVFEENNSQNPHITGADSYKKYSNFKPQPVRSDRAMRVRGVDFGWVAKTWVSFAKANMFASALLTASDVGNAF
jgi:hypothetical protein